MKATSLAALFLFFCVPASAIAVADSPPSKGVAINASGTYRDRGVWLYRTADGKYSYGPAIDGTNEMLVMPSPSPDPGGTVAAVEILRHRFDTLGYPMRISLVEKLFASSLQIDVFASDNGELWSYAYGDAVVNEKPAAGSQAGRPAFKSWGPFHADAVPLAQAPEAVLQPAFDFAKNAMNSIGNMPASQKQMSSYGVLFIDDGNTVWVEFGPRFGAQESPHLGCQTQLGRDMVFGYDEKPSSGGQIGKFLQCF